MIQFLLLISRHGKTRLNKYYRHYTSKERTAIQKEVSILHPYYTTKPDQTRQIIKVQTKQE